ncbi:putative glutathione S-transferase 1, isoform D-like [Penaeus vannamei]|uniref:Putative glutathione S-transferase 1, isoform D-like n=1 Tax=Penaeus vannamei TaxID=6689 RepID=A0A3R7PR84_PENVA|nr:putative glutathione S-transferase 1, isoform D-like [Penaeus vannamei]
MPLDFYYMDMSPPCRAVMLTAKAVGVDLNLKLVNIMTGDHRKPEFLKYGKDDSFYPNNPKARCIVDQRLYFDIGTLYQKWADYAYPGLRGQPINHSLLEGIHEALSFLNANLMDFPWAAGNKITVADFSLVATISSMEAAGVNLEQHPRIVQWLKRCKTKMVGYQEANEVEEMYKQCHAAIRIDPTPKIKPKAPKKSDRKKRNAKKQAMDNKGDTGSEKRQAWMATVKEGKAEGAMI